MLTTHFMSRGYPKHLVKKALEKTDILDMEELLNKETLKKSTTPKKPQEFYYVTTHNPANQLIKEIISSNWDILGKTKTSRPFIILESETVFGLHRNKNLFDHLVQASTSNKQNDEKLVVARPCKRPSTCRYCPKLNTSGNFILKTNNQKFISKVNINCQSTNCIYLITCSHCGIQ